MIMMHSLFDLVESCSVADFQDTVNALAQHLKERDLLVSSRFMRHEPHDGYNANEPSSSYYLAI